MKRGYFVSSKDEFQGVGVVASSTKEAKKIAFSSGELNDVFWTDLRARWEHTAEVEEQPIGIVRDMRVGLLCGLYGFVEGYKCDDCGKEDVLKLCAGKALCDDCIEKEYAKSPIKMNIYEVISETLYDYECMDYGPPEPYCIAHLVAAETPSQARYLAWKSSADFIYDLREMPDFSVHIRKKNVYIEKGIVTNDEEFQDCWRDEEE